MRWASGVGRIMPACVTPSSEIPIDGAGPGDQVHEVATGGAANRCQANARGAMARPVYLQHRTYLMRVGMAIECRLLTCRLHVTLASGRVPMEASHVAHDLVPLGYAPRTIWRRTAFAIAGSASVAQSELVLGYVAAKNASPKRLQGFRQGLTELNYIEGQNIRIDYSEAVVDAEYHSVMTELVGSKVTIFLAANAPAAIAAAKATKIIPIVMSAVNDPVGLGLRAGRWSSTTRALRNRLVRARRSRDGPLCGDLSWQRDKTIELSP